MSAHALDDDEPAHARRTLGVTDMAYAAGHGRGRSACGRWQEDLSASLLALYDCASRCGLDEFEVSAARQLGALIGFDGAVWGMGAAGGDDAPLTITHAAVIDRPAGLLADYAAVAAHDPVTASFLAAPCAALAVDVDARYDGKTLAAMRDYLHAYDIGHLMLLGTRGGRGDALAWITAYRENGAPFGAEDIQRYRAVLPHWIQARRICAGLQLRCGALAGAVRDGAALCDRLGLVHAADACFSALTGLAAGDRLDAVTLASLGAQGRARLGAVDVDAGTQVGWWLLRAHAPAVAAELPARLAEVARRYAEGATHKQIARDLQRSPATIRTQLQTIFGRLGVHTRTELMRVLEAH